MTNVAAQAKAARIAGAMYLITIAPAVFSQFFVQSSLVVPSNATQTALNIIEHERLFRVGIASELVSFMGVVALIGALYVLLKPVNRHLAMLAACWRMAEVGILCVATLGSMMALALLGGAHYLSTFDAGELYSLARLALGARGTGYNLGLMLFGLGSAVFNYLLLRSGYIPKALAASGVFSSMLVLISAFWFLVFPNTARLPQLVSYALLFVYEVILGSWLLFKGASIQSAPTKAA